MQSIPTACMIKHERRFLKSGATAILGAPLRWHCTYMYLVLYSKGSATGGRVRSSSASPSPDPCASARLTEPGRCQPRQHRRCLPPARSPELNTPAMWISMPRASTSSSSGRPFWFSRLRPRQKVEGNNQAGQGSHVRFTIFSPLEASEHVDIVSEYSL